VLLLRALRIARKHLATVSWTALAVLVLLHFAASWALMAAAGEERLVEPTIWVYFYATVSLTIGFGDFSPQTDAGRLVAAFFLMPGAVALLASMIGKTTAVLADLWQRGLYGKRTYRDMNQHTILVGWNGRESHRIVDLLRREEQDAGGEIVIVDVALEANPRPDEARFVKLATLADPTGYERAGVRQAKRVIVDAPTDEQTLAAAFAVRSFGGGAHVVAHFDLEESATLLKRHHPEVECTTPVQAELIVRASHDLGASSVAMEMLSIADGPTQYSLALPLDAGSRRYGDYLALLRRQHRATLLGYAVREAPLKAILNADDDVRVPAGATLFYVGSRRIEPGALAASLAAA
jgi:voltage-gated potassium channel